MTTPLAAKIRRLIAADGPMPVSTYFQLCLADPEYGYYRTRDPLGRGGDFTTAPEISQLFGELVGIFLVQAWQAHGAPANTVLIEGGPGRGTMMADILKVIETLAPPLYATLSVRLLETSPTLRARQAETLKRHAERLSWIDALGEAPEGLCLFVANELFDAIPTRQFVKAGGGFFERVVTLDDNGNFTFSTAPARLDPKALPDGTAPEGAIFETAPAREALMAELCARLRAGGGTALIIDYGHLESGFGDTLQAVRDHSFDPVLDHPGEADLTSHVDFAALAAIGRAEGLHVHPMMPQGAFLADLGLGPRASALGRGKDAATQASIVTAARRLAGNGEGEMGDLFKVLAVSSRKLALIPFEQPEAAAP
ncbi:class I SAM-dependent methyltransferase [Martelella endophytica]|uniref:TetR family transcriptional regulator n=1 Tax=Martelella endophytica TaxID=1486262 RepID=A0A0D5LWF4_MAREN|nr:class I SAM-dependent methyltransferase [Martelella endophytica]AJY48112.1 TetR family transcriptional regulator [Martelella endophytica]